MDEQHLIEVKNLKKYFGGGGILKKKPVTKAVDNVSFSIAKGETFGLIGESGCGKSTVARTMIRLYNPTSGSVIFDGIDIARLGENELMPYRRRIQMIFQDPYASLNPRMTVKRIISEPLNAHNICPKSEYEERVAEALLMVGLEPAHMGKYPHEFSGGQRQRIGIARAIIIRPDFIICDEPISALDVSIQAQVVNMLQTLQEQLGLTYCFIAHDLAMVKYISKRMAVMYVGQLVEVSPSEELYRTPLHPYTIGLMKSVPIADPKIAKMKDEVSIEGEIPSPSNPPSGCRFRTRCPKCMEICKEVSPTLKEITPNHFVACHLF
ncbi:MAG: ATP-binding cassette domain-containing protein [Anaerolineaceae bacterium]|nr:ATP-binding cassette domain-containing protein [Anaerolineaceae bacterium]